MRKKETVNTFSQEYDKRARLNKINESSWFGISLGLFMLSVGFYQSLYTVGLWYTLHKIICGIGLLLLLVGSLLPSALNKPVCFIKKFFSIIGKYLLTLLLLPIYSIFSIINIFMKRKYSIRFKYISWEYDTEAEPVFEDYIEAIYIIEQEKGEIKSIDIATKLGVSKPAVNKAMNELNNLNLIEKYYNTR